MSKTPKQPIRNFSAKQDLGSKESIVYNDAAGADKVILIDPPIKKAVGVAENVGAGKYVKITGTSYTLDVLDRAYDVATEYAFGDVVTNGGFVYQSNADQNPGAFDVTKWSKKADKVIGPITITAGSTVTTGRWHNTVSVVGFLVEDSSDTIHYRQRD